jgi:hypothetical protein
MKQQVASHAHREVSWQPWALFCSQELMVVFERALQREVHNATGVLLCHHHKM